MKKPFPIIAAIFAAATINASGQNAVDTTLGTAAADADTSVNTSFNTPVNTSSDNAPIDTLPRAAVGALADTVISVYDDTPAETLVNAAGGAPIDTPVNAFADTRVDTPRINTPTGAPIDTPVATAGTPDRADAPEKIFLLPAYAFQLAFLVASVALIAATLYFFLTRRDRNDSRRFLTTTRLSVLDKLVQRGCRYVESNYPDPALTPETVCNSLVTGKAYLDALFMNELGINVQDFIVQVRVNAIKNRLSAPPQARTPDIDEICVECGFADRAEAERCFSSVCAGVGIAEFARFSKMQNQRR